MGVMQEFHKVKTPHVLLQEENETKRLTGLAVTFSSGLCSGFDNKNSSSQSVTSLPSAVISWPNFYPGDLASLPSSIPPHRLFLTAGG